jgi:hypothetical protein
MLVKIGVIWRSAIARADERKLGGKDARMQ